MVTFTAPAEDAKFLLKEVIGTSDLCDIPYFADFSEDLIDAIIEEGGKFYENVFLPINQNGDEEGCRYEDKQVFTPKGFKEAYQQCVDNGWSSVVAHPDYEGQGLPKTVGYAQQEFACSTNIALGIYLSLNQGGAFLIEKYASKALKDAYLSKLNTGVWAGTMCLTEPQCGTDLGMIKTKADPQEDGSYKITGTKIFITGGEHDLTENIVHLVLAKLPDAPEGTKGISVFLVPKFLPDNHGNPGERNNVFCGSIEEKMGIHGSATCVMNFDDATGYLVGEKHSGMEAMFVMMNSERLLAGVQGLGLSEISYQNALTYAKERLQGRSISGVKSPDTVADPIIVHPDIRKNLLTMKAYNEGCRALAYHTAKQIDLSEHHEDPAVRQEADDYVALMTPVIKAFFTDMGFDSTNIGMQIMGGYGYIREYGMEQLSRDARIAQIYEGANGIQALDLVGRKMGQNMGRPLRRFFHPALAFIEENRNHKALQPLLVPFEKTLLKLQKITLMVAQKGMKNPDEAGAASYDYLKALALVAIGFMWLRMAKASFDALESGNLVSSKTFYTSKIKTARYFMSKLLPQTAGLFLNILAGAEPLMDFEVDEF